MCALLRKSPVATAGHEDRGDKWIPCLQENTLEAQENFVVYEEHVKPIKSELSSCCCSFCRLQFFSSLASSVTTQRAGLVSEGGGTHTHYTQTHTTHTHNTHTTHRHTHTQHTHVFFFTVLFAVSLKIDSTGLSLSDEKSSHFFIEFPLVKVVKNANYQLLLYLRCRVNKLV